MAANTPIEWCNRPGTIAVAWNPVRGCKATSPGCARCYARRLAAVRLSGPGRPYEGLAVMTDNGPRWTGEVARADHLLRRPLRWRKPRTVFVDSMADLFYDARPDADIDDVFVVMLICALHAARIGHTFIILTKFAERMHAWATAPDLAERLAKRAGNLMEDGDGWHDCVWQHVNRHGPAHDSIWLLVSAEDQQRADERIPLLLRTPATVRGVSYEPALGPVDLRLRCRGPGGRSIDWLIAGAESGPGARPMNLDWVRSVRDQCQAAGVPMFFKQHVDNCHKVSLPVLDGRRWTEFPR